MPSRDAAESRSTAATFGNAKKHDAIVKKLWGVAKSCPTFSKKVTVNGRTTTRTDRLIGSHSYKIALAGAVRAHTTRTRRELFRLGMTPQEALYTATVRPAEFFGLDSEMGELRAGFIADGVLLDANPLQNIRHTRRVQGVLHRGRFLNRPDLDRLVAE